MPSSTGDAIPLRPFGRHNIKVSASGFGGHHLGDVSDRKTAVRLERQAVDGGVTFFDNCWEYHRGKTEDWMGAERCDPAPVQAAAANLLCRGAMPDHNCKQKRENQQHHSPNPAVMSFGRGTGGERRCRYILAGRFAEVHMNRVLPVTGSRAT